MMFSSAERFIAFILKVLLHPLHEKYKKEMKQMNLTYKTERCSQTLKANSWLLRRNMRGVWNGYAHTAIFTMDNQPRPTVGHMETCSMLCGSLDGRGVWGRIDTCILLLLSHLSCVQLCATPSLGFSRQEHWSGLPFPSPMHKSEK